MALTRQQLKNELSQQKKALSGLKSWIQSLFLIAVLAAVFCFCGLSRSGLWKVMGIVGAIVLVLSMLLMTVVALGAFRGSRNIRKMELALKADTHQS